MTTNELLAVIDREAGLLTADNWHAAAAILHEAAEHLRRDVRARRLLAELIAADEACNASGVRSAMDALRLLPKQ